MAHETIGVVLVSLEVDYPLSLPMALWNVIWGGLSQNLSNSLVFEEFEMNVQFLQDGVSQHQASGKC